MDASLPLTPSIFRQLAPFYEDFLILLFTRFSHIAKKLFSVREKLLGRV